MDTPAVTDLLSLFAEVTIGIAGFSAIVLAVRGKSVYNAQNRDVFIGMLVHCSQALLYSILPMVCLLIFPAAKVWFWLTLIAAGFTTLHMLGVLIQEWKRGWGVRIGSFIEATLGVLLLINLSTEWSPAAHVYPVAPFIHLFQSFLLFLSMLIQSPSSTPSEN